MKLLMVSGDRSLLEGKKGAFWYTLEEFSKHWERIDVICPRSTKLRVANGELRFGHTQKATPDSYGGSVSGESAQPQPIRNSQFAIQTFFGNVHIHPSPWSLWNQPKWISQQGMKIWQAYRPDVMTVHDFPPFYNGLGAARLSKATGMPYALEVHHIVGHPVAADFKERIGKWLSWMYLRFDARRASSVRTVNKSVAETLGKWGIPPSKIRVVPSFYLDAGLLGSSAEVPKRYDVAFSGRLVSNKGLEGVLRAIAKLPDITLLVVGDGPERESAKKLSEELKIGHRVEFAGWLPTQEDVIRAIRSAKIFVMNSKSEGGPRIALEAMAAGLPVVATKVGIMPDVLEDGRNGVFTTGDPIDLSEKLTALLADAPARARIGTEACRILERFERTDLIGRYALFLKELVSVRG